MHSMGFGMLRHKMRQRWNFLRDRGPIEFTKRALANTPLKTQRFISRFLTARLISHRDNLKVLEKIKGGSKQVLKVSVSLANTHPKLYSYYILSATPYQIRKYGKNWVEETVNTAKKWHKKYFPDFLNKEHVIRSVKDPFTIIGVQRWIKSDPAVSGLFTNIPVNKNKIIKLCVVNSSFKKELLKFIQRVLEAYDETTCLFDFFNPEESNILWDSERNKLVIVDFHTYHEYSSAIQSRKNEIEEVVASLREILNKFSEDD